MFIGEIGINHNGDIDIALELISKAKAAGVDVVKFQKRDLEICIPDDQKYAIKDSIFGKMKYIDYKRKLEFEKEEYDLIDEYCASIDMKWTASVWDINSLNFILRYKVPFIKVPSARTNDFDLLKEVNKCGLPVVIGVGATSEFHMVTAINLLSNAKDLTILHCNSTYPSNINELDLKYITTLKQMFPDHKIGYSGHENGYLPTMVAKSLGADVIERHITLSKDLPGSDQKASLNITELTQLIESLREIEIILGRSDKTVYPSELKVMEKLRLK